MENALLVTSWIRTGSAQSDASSSQLLRSGPALCVLTDFSREEPNTVPSDRTVDAALIHMEQARVQALPVTRALRGSSKQQVIGLVTFQDIRRQRAGLHQQRPRHASDVRVNDVMTPWEGLSPVNYDSLRSVTAGELYETFQGTGLTHLVVVETHENNCVYVRGLLSRATLARRLGRSEDPTRGSRLSVASGGRRRVA
jgi:CBS-domain-containing membrane protein